MAAAKFFRLDSTTASALRALSPREASLIRPWMLEITLRAERKWVATFSRSSGFWLSDRVVLGERGARCTAETRGEEPERHQEAAGQLSMLRARGIYAGRPFLVSADQGRGDAGYFDRMHHEP